MNSNTGAPGSVRSVNRARIGETPQTPPAGLGQEDIEVWNTSWSRK